MNLNPDQPVMDGDVAFRLPALKPRYEDSQNTEQTPLKETRTCPRETRVLAAFEHAVSGKKQRRVVKKRRRKSRRKVEEHVDAMSGSPSSENGVQTFLRHILDSDLSTLHNTTDVVGYLVRELTEVREAIENNKNRLRKETIKGLWKVIAGVLHTMGEANSRIALSSTTSPFRYENYSKALSLTPRFFQELEKRDPVVHTPQLCRGCRAGGPLPWIYLYPNREVYRTGGGFDCALSDFESPVIKSEKPATTPRTPFKHSRGKLVDTREHRLPAKRKHKTTVPHSFNLETNMRSSVISLELPRIDNSLSSTPSSDVDHRIGPSSMKNSSLSPRSGQLSKPEHKTALAGSVAASGVTKVSFRTPIKGSNNRRESSSGQSSGQGSCESSGQSSGQHSDPISGRIAEDATTKDYGHVNDDDEKDESTDGAPGARVSTGHQKDVVSKSRETSPMKKHSQIRLQSLNKKFTNIVKHKEPSFESDQMINDKIDQLNEEEKQLAMKLRMRIEPPKTMKMFNVAHNSTLLKDKPKEPIYERRPFLGSKVSPSKFGGFAKNKRITDINNSITTRSLASTTGLFKQDSNHSNETASLASSGDLSLRFSSSLSLNFSDADAGNDVMSFSLAGEKMNPTFRKSEQKEKFNAPIPHVKPSATEVKSGQFEKSANKHRSKKQRKSKKTSVVQLDSGVGVSLTSHDEKTPSAIVGSTSHTSGFDSGLKNERKGSTYDLWDTQMLHATDEENSEFSDEFFDSFEQEGSTLQTLGKPGLRKAKRRRTLDYRMEPLSTYTLRRGSRTDQEIFLRDEEDHTMLDYAARYCIISLERLSKYENIFNTYAGLEVQTGEQAQGNLNNINEEIVGETDQQKTLLNDYEKLVFGMDVYQQRISETDRKKHDLIHKQHLALERLSNNILDDADTTLIEAKIQGFSSQITSLENRVKQYLGKIKKMIEKKKDIQDKLKEAGMDDDKIQKLVQTTDFLERRFAKMKNLQMDILNLPAALRIINRNFNDEDFKFVTRILQLPKDECLDFKAFAIVAALAERVQSLDKSIKNLLKDVDLTNLERKLDKCKELYRLLSQVCPSNGSKLVSVDDLSVELQAGGIKDDHQKSVIKKLDHHGQGFIDFLDFVLYVPLFLMIHDQIISQPF
eukprot:gene12010-13250_t